MRSLFTMAIAVGIGLANTSYAQLFNRKPAPAKTEVNHNQQLADAVAEKIKKSGVAVGTTNLTVSAQNGVVELTGNVKSLKQADQLVQTSMSVAGVVKVETSLRIIKGLDVQPVNGQEPTAAAPPAVVLPPGNIPPAVHLMPNDPLPLAAPGMPAYDMTGPKMPPFAWPTYAPYPNMSRVAYPQAYPYNAFPYIGPYYPFPKVPLGWRSVKLEWEDGHWYLGRLSTPHDYWRVKFW